MKRDAVEFSQQLQLQDMVEAHGFALVLDALVGIARDDATELLKHAAGPVLGVRDRAEAAKLDLAAAILETAAERIREIRGER